LLFSISAPFRVHKTGNPQYWIFRRTGISEKDGDYVICEPCQYAQNGEIVAALIRHEEATVKRFYLRKNVIELKPENPSYPSMTYGFGEVFVQGRVIGLIRAF
jgi:SOS-response transcriptional repressor LexA